MPLGVSAAVQTFRSELRQAYDEAHESDLYEWYDAVDKLDICECVRYLLPSKSWALAKKSKWVARQYVIMYATDTDLSLADINERSELAQANLRNKLWKGAADALRDELKDQGALDRARAALGPMESTAGLSNAPKRKRAKLSDSNVSAGARAETADERQKRLAERARNARTMMWKAAQISPPTQPLMTETFRNTAISERLMDAIEMVYASYLAIRVKITARTKNFQPFYNELLAVVEQALGAEYWRPKHVSNEALRAIREAMRSNRKPALQQGHGTTATHLAQAQFLKRLLRQGDVEAKLDVLRYLSHNNETCMITAAQNAADVQLGPDEMRELPADLTLFWRSGRACKFGAAEIAWAKAQPEV
jgi:hypothetical protein